MTLQEETIYEIKETLRYQPIQPEYNPEEWEGKKFNCYIYAMRICKSFIKKRPYGVPGFIAGINELKDEKDDVLRNFKADCEELGLKVVESSIDEKICSCEYKIAIYVAPGTDFHFARQDKDGTWSEKKGWNGPIKIIKTEDVTKNYRDYEFVGIFKVSKKE